MKPLDEEELNRVNRHTRIGAVILSSRQRLLCANCNGQILSRKFPRRCRGCGAEICAGCCDTPGRCRECTE